MSYSTMRPSSAEASSTAIFAAVVSSSGQILSGFLPATMQSMPVLPRKTISSTITEESLRTLATRH